MHELNTKVIPQLTEITARVY